MESLSRPPHRRKHSTTTNIFSSSFSFKNPYDDVLLPNGGGRKSLEVHDYSEIFAGSSSIPMLDLSLLDERVGSGDFRTSELDYSSIFGGLRNDDVLVPYEELLNGSAKKTKQRIPAEAQPDLQEPGSLHSSRKTKRSSGEASDQSADGVKQQFNISFNRTNQRNGDASDGKTHIAQLHAVPGFTQFLNGTPRLHKKKNDKLPSLKREVSRSWSFSAEVEPVKDKGGSTSEKSQIPGKSHNGNELNLKSQFSIVLTPSSCPSDLTPPSTCPSDLTPPSGCASDLSSVKDPMQSMASNFASKKDASHKLSGESSPPFFGEEFDANSVDAVSAAALKKAIDQAQESIRIAKMIMERKKEAYQEGSKPRPTSRLKVLEKETTLDHEAYGSKDNNAMEEYDELDPIFTVFAGIDGKFTPSLSHSDRINNATNSEVERVWQNVEAEKELEDAIAGESKLFDSNCSQSEAPHIDENVKLEKLEKNVEAAEMHREAKDFPVLVDNAVCRTADLGPGNVGNINYFIPFTCKLVSKLGWFKTSKEDFERSNVTFHHTKGSEFVPELVERDSNTPQGMQGMAKNVEEYESCEASFDHAEGPEKMVGRVLSASQRSSEQDKVVDEVGKKFSISQEGGVYKQRENDANDKEKCGKNLEEHEEMLNVEHLLLRSEFNNVLNDSCNPVRNESLEQEEMEKKSKNVSEWKGNGHRHGKTCDEEISGLRQKKAHPCFRSKEQLKEALLEEVNDREPYVSPEIGEVEKKVNETHKPETDDKKHNHADDGDKPKLAEEVMQNTVEERHDNTCEYEVAGTIIMEATHCGEVQKTAAIWDAEEAENTLGSAERSEDIHDKCQFQEAAYEEDIDEAVDLSSSNASTIFDEAHNNDASTIIGEIREACDVDLDNKAEEHQKAVTNNKENDTLPEVNKTVSAIDNDKQLFHMQDNEMIGTNSLHQSDSEEIFVQNEPHDAFEGLSSDGKKETVGVMAADPEENLPEDEDVSRATSDIHDASEEYAAKINRQNLPELLASDIRTAEFDLTDVRQVTGRPSESDEGSVSASSSEKIDGLSAHESEECAENVKDRTSEKGDLKDDLEMVSDERKFAEELNDELYSQLRSEPNKLNKPMETETAAEIGLNMEKNKDNIAGTSPTEERDAKEDVQNSEGSDQQQRIEAIKRGRARERDRLAVERAIREARERAFAEARERVERAAVERAAAEVRQRVMEEAREKVEKASVVKQPIDKASTEAKLRAERAAVERATAEARERALEKAMSQKISTEARTPADRHPTEGFSGSSRNSVLKHSFSSSDLETGTESAQRRKARLERHQRIMERAAKALAEKNMRDLLAQKEQAERNRLAESLDADIKRWATGKEGNLRALLSTLQYILGPDSGWQPISLTEIITTAAVKKAYRKATLYVHPDKLQQRGASVQQKYICEKVFDLLKAAWNRFNSDER